MTAGPNDAVVRATPQALDVVERLVAEYGDLAFVQSGGCCDGSSPLCMRRGEFLLRKDDLLLGYLGGVPFYVDGEIYDRWNKPEFIVDVTPGAGDNFSLEGRLDLHFYLLPPAFAPAT